MVWYGMAAEQGLAATQYSSAEWHKCRDISVNTMWTINKYYLVDIMWAT